jgi:hypothetical protein
MRPFRVSLWCCALAALAVGNGSAGAAWNNVFQVCCHSCRSSSSYAAPVAVPAPSSGCQQCTTNYVQRSYYQPVVTYRRSCYVEPVTSYRTSYYYEPCTSYRYSCYYDPCSCSYQQVAQPVTTYRLRSQCCPVTSYLERCCLQPVTTYQQVNYYEPQTTCCTTTIGAPVAAPPPGAGVAVQQPAVQGAGVQQPAVSGAPIASPPTSVGQPNGSQPGGNGTIEPPGQAGQTSHSSRVPFMPPAQNGTSYRSPQLQSPQPARPTAPATSPRVRYDRITSTPQHNAEGQLLKADRSAQARTKIVFVCADGRGGRETTVTDEAGRFQTTLAAGNWLMYTQDAEGRWTFQRKLRVESEKPALPITLVCR